ncbi:MAG: iron-containing alcohol dehydrogenase [Lachnospiraceae bacterium]|nr:iron-containing alcohol dehydrogenase [Lachnospiraceae bacterium]
MEMNRKAYQAVFPGALYAGFGSLLEIPGILEREGAGRAVLLLDDALKESSEVRGLQEKLGGSLAGTLTGLPIEPSRDSIRSVYDAVREKKGDLLIAVGGGSIMDMTKVVAAALTNTAFAESGFCDTSLIRKKTLPTVMVPTTAGTGAEATPNAIFLIPEQELKVGLVSPQFTASYCVLDPALTLGLPRRLTASTGMDALCHAIESYLSKKANLFSRMLSGYAAALIAANIERACEDGSDREARENMLLGSFIAGMCLSTSGTVAVHALSYPLGGKYHIPHGVSNAILLPEVLKVNLPYCREQYGQLADLMLPWAEWSREEKPERFVEYVELLCRRLGIPESLTEYGVGKEDVEFLTKQAMEVRRLLDQNPHALSEEEIAGVYRKLLK